MTYQPAGMTLGTQWKSGAVVVPGQPRSIALALLVSCCALSSSVWVPLGSCMAASWSPSQGMHAAHPLSVLALLLPLASTIKKPASQRVERGMHLESPGSFEKPSSSVHGAHRSLPLPDAKVPIGQGMHRVLPSTAEKVPGGHAVQLPVPLSAAKDPRLQGAQAYEPLAKVPGSQGLQLVPFLTPMLPAWHLVHADCPACWLTSPCGHAVQLAALVPPGNGRNLPTGQLSHLPASGARM